jgi:hypothetical protein
MARSAWVAAALVATLLVGTTGCTVLSQATFPTITDLTDRTGWLGTADATKLFAADTTHAGTYRVMIQFSQHSWLPPAHEFVVSPSPENPNIYVFRVPNPEVFLNNQIVFYRWLVLGSGPSDLDSIYAQTPDSSLQIGCVPGQMTTDLRADQARVLAFLGPLTTLTGPQDTVALAVKGYEIKPHAQASLSGMGFAVARLPSLAGVAGGTTGPLGMPVLGTPSLLMYAPTIPASAPSGAATDPIADYPYTFVGWAYTGDFNPAVRPTVGCFAWDSWFLHEAGWHEPSGAFTPTPPPGEATPCTGIINTPPFRFLPVAWHPRFWDLHLWVNTTTGTPTVGITHPTLTIPGWPTVPAGFFPCPVTR